MASNQSKLCSICGIDVSNLKRVKDTTGKYYCHPCIDKHHTSQNSFSREVPRPEINFSTSESKECPFCAETIKANAVKCRYCGEMLDSSNPKMTINPVCTGCGNQFPESDLVDYSNGVTLCTSCVSELRDNPTTELPISGTKRMSSVEAKSKSFLLQIIIYPLCVILFIGGIGAALAGIFLTVDFLPPEPEIIRSIGSVAGAAIGGGIFFYFIYLANKYLNSTRCPSCKYYGVAAITNKEVTNSSERIVNTTRNVQIREGNSSFGQVLANMDVPEQQRFIDYDVEHDHICKHCGYTWTTKAVITRQQ